MKWYDFDSGLQTSQSIVSIANHPTVTTTIISSTLPPGASFQLASRSGSTSNYALQWLSDVIQPSLVVCFQAKESSLGWRSLGSYCVTMVQIDEPVQQLTGQEKYMYGTMSWAKTSGSTDQWDYSTEMGKALRYLLCQYR
jgi:hypothetical protein